MIYDPTNTLADDEIVRKLNTEEVRSPESVEQDALDLRLGKFTD